MKHPRIIHISWFIPPYKAVTIPPFWIFIKKQHLNDQKILNHEMIHWQQYQRMGLFKFYFQYLKQFLIFGYDKMPMEMEAKKVE